MIVCVITLLDCQTVSQYYAVFGWLWCFSCFLTCHHQLGMQRAAAGAIFLISAKFCVVSYHYHMITVYVYCFCVGDRVFTCSFWYYIYSTRKQHKNSTPSWAIVYASHGSYLLDGSLVALHFIPCL